MRDENATTLNKYDIYGNVVASNNDIRLGHANDITSDTNGNLLVIGEDYKILRVNKNNLEIIEEIESETNVFSIAMDADNTYYGLSETTLYHFNSNFEVIESYTHNLSFTFQGIAINGNYIYCPVNEIGQIIVLTKHATYHSIIKTNVGPDRTEPEFIYFYDNILYMGIQTQDGFGFIIEFKYNDANSLVSIEYNNATNSFASTYYIDSDSITGSCNGSRNNPIGSIDMALAMRMGSIVNIYLRGEFTKHAYYISNISNVTITRFDDNSTYKIGTLNLSNCVNSSVQHGTFDTLVIDSCESTYLAVNDIATLNIYRSRIDLSSYNTLSAINISNSTAAIIPNQNLDNPTIDAQKTICKLTTPITLSNDTDSTGKTYTCNYLGFTDKFIVGVKSSSGFQANVFCSKIYGNRYIGSAISRPGSANWKIIVLDFTINGNSLVVGNAYYQELSNLQNEVAIGIQTLDFLV